MLALFSKSEKTQDYKKNTYLTFTDYINVKKAMYKYKNNGTTISICKNEIIDIQDFLQNLHKTKYKIYKLDIDKIIKIIFTGWHINRCSNFYKILSDNVEIHFWTVENGITRLIIKPNKSKLPRKLKRILKNLTIEEK